ncbi:MAG: hypothetical protein ACC652_15970, partial [Acidimicrobiales bacterium]
YQELYGDQFGFEEWTPTAEELAEINAQTDKEAKALTDVGVKFTVETDDFGIRFIVWDAGQDEAAWKALESLYGEIVFGGDEAGFEDLPGFDEDWTPSAEEVAEANADMAEEMAALKAAGVKFTVETDEFGFEYPVWEDDQAEAAMKVYEELYGLWDLGDYDDIDELPILDEPLLPEELKTVGSTVPPEAP